MNAKKEFMRLVKEAAPQTLVACEVIDERYPNEIWPVRLKVGHSQDEYERFLHMIDFEYDNGYGAQYLFGTAWFTGGVWAVRDDYDGSEWWEIHVCPEIPEGLK